MRQSVKSALGCAGFILGLVALLALFSRVALPKGNSAADGMPNVPASGIDAEPPGTIDVIFVGDSECYYTFMPLLLWREQGFTSYVCATPSQTLNQTVRWLRRACKNQSPKLIVLETDALYTGINYGDALLDPVERVFPLLEHHNRWKNLRWRDFWAEPEYRHIVRDKGYVYNDETVAFETAAAEEDDGYVGRLRSAYLRQIGDYCREHGIPLLLVSAPSMVTWSDARLVSASRAAQSLGADYLNLNALSDEIGLDWRNDTFDQGYHLNVSGATKVTTYFGQYLSQHYSLPDHRGDKAYKAWNKAAKKALKDAI